MTPDEERAGHVRLTGTAGEVRTRIAAAIRAAVAAEREACAEVAATEVEPDDEEGEYWIAIRIAKAIRDRRP